MKRGLIKPSFEESFAAFTSAAEPSRNDHACSRRLHLLVAFFWLVVLCNRRH